MVAVAAILLNDPTNENLQLLLAADMGTHSSCRGRGDILRLLYMRNLREILLITLTVTCVTQSQFTISVPHHSSHNHAPEVGITAALWGYMWP